MPLRIKIFPFVQHPFFIQININVLPGIKSGLIPFIIASFFYSNVAGGGLLKSRSCGSAFTQDDSGALVGTLNGNTHANSLLSLTINRPLQFHALLKTLKHSEVSIIQYFLTDKWIWALKSGRRTADWEVQYCSVNFLTCTRLFFCWVLIHYYFSEWVSIMRPMTRGLAPIIHVAIPSFITIETAGLNKG